MTGEKVEASAHGEELMEVDIADASNGCLTEIRQNGLLLWPVSPQEGGEGLPYAPVNWPNEGDVWGWRVGKRVACSGYYLDRYLYPPPRFQKARRKRDGFASKLSVEQFVVAKFPGTDVNAFFSSFSWKIPSKHAYLLKDEHGSIHIQSGEIAEQSPFNMYPDAVRCKAGNRFCSSLVEDQMTSAAAHACDICCSEPGFCRECSCILCSKPVESVLGGYSFIRCEAIVHGDLICGHVAHLNCALRAYMAGIVGGTIGLDTEYYCRRCDTVTNLTKHVTNLLKTCESVESEEDMEKLLTVGICLLQGSKKKDSQKMLNRFHSMLKKLKAGCTREDVWKVEVDAVPVPTGPPDQVNFAPTDAADIDLLHDDEYLKLEEEIDQVLWQLKSSQKLEFRIAQDKLYAQKDRLLNLYQQVRKEKSELKHSTLSPDRSALLNSIAAREEQIKCELSKLRDMEKVSDGFGRSPRQLLKEHFDLDSKE